MTPQTVMTLGREALMVALLLSAPLLGVGLIVGILVSILQAVTSIQDMTLSFVPKLIAGAAAVLLFGPWMMMLMVNFTARILGNLQQFAR